MSDVETLQLGHQADDGSHFDEYGSHYEEVNPLQHVFNACDYNGDGFVKISDLLSLAKEYANESETGNEVSVFFFICVL